jgi:hypothetical protein
MSTALVPFKAPSNPTSALALALSGDPGEAFAFDTNAVCNQDDVDDYYGLDLPIPRINANAAMGRFHEAGLKDKQAIDDAPKELVGVILARLESNVHFMPQDKSLVTSLGYGTLLDVEKTICKNHNMKYPSQAKLSPGLSDAQMATAKAIGIGGATGRGCQGCVANKFYSHGDRNVRPCTQTENIVWLDSNNLSEPVVLQISAGTSIVEWRKFLAETFRKGKQKFWLASAVLKLSWISREIKGNQVRVLTASVVHAVPPEGVLRLLAARDNNMHLLEKATRDMEEQGVIPGADTAASDVPPPGDSDYVTADDVDGIPF